MPTTSRSGDADAMTERSFWDGRGALWGVFGVALATRLTHLAFTADSALILHPTIDPAAYLARAREILGGSPFPDDVFFQDPLYPFLLAGMLALTGGWGLGPYVGHAVVSAAACVLLVIVGRRWASARAGAIAGMAAALYAPFLYLDGMLEKNAFTIAALLGSLAAFPRPGARAAGRAAASGFLLGCGALLRGNFLLLVPALALELAWERRVEGWRRALGAAALFGAAALAPIAPFTIHNYRASGDFILTTAQAGTAFYLGNNPQNASGGIHHVSFNRQVPEYEANDWRREAERRAGRPMTRKEVSAFWFAQAWGHIARDPGLGWWLGLVAKKAELIVNRVEVPDNATFEGAARASLLLRWDPVRFGTVAPLGLLGLALLARGWRRRAPMWIACGVYGVSLLFFPVSDRFRAPFAAFVIVGFGAAVDAAWGWIERSEWRRLALAAAAAAALAVVVNHSPCLQPPNTNIRPEQAALKAAHDEADAWIQAREWDRAEGVLREAMADPWLASKARLNLDLAYVRWYGRGDAAGARDLVRKSVKALLDEGESVPDGYQLYAEILESEGKGDEARYWLGRNEAATAEAPGALVLRASQLSSEGDVARALGILDEVVFIDRARPAAAVPAEAYVQLARMLRGRGDRPRASDVAKALVARGGALPEDLADLAK